MNGMLLFETPCPVAIPYDHRIFVRLYTFSRPAYVRYNRQYRTNLQTSTNCSDHLIRRATPVQKTLPQLMSHICYSTERSYILRGLSVAHDCLKRNSLAQTIISAYSPMFEV